MDEIDKRIGGIEREAIKVAKQREYVFMPCVDVEDTLWLIEGYKKCREDQKFQEDTINILKVAIEKQKKNNEQIRRRTKEMCAERANLEMARIGITTEGRTQVCNAIEKAEVK